MSSSSPRVEDEIKQESTFSKSIIQNFISDLGCEFSPTTSTTQTPGTLESHVCEIFHSWNLTQSHLSPLLRLAPGVCTLGDLAFSHLPPATKAYVIILTIFYIYIDDASNAGALPELPEFTSRFAKGESQGHPILVQYTRHLCIETPKHYGPYGASCIIKASVDFIIGCNLEAMFTKGFPKIRSRRFPRFVRTKTGAGEAFAHAMFPQSLFPEEVWLRDYIVAVPDIVVVCDLGNDVLSFYKECVVGCEEGTFVQMCAEALETSLVEALRGVCEDVVKAHSTTLEVLGKGGEGVRGVYVGFVEGFVRWHCTQARYRLGEVME